MSDFDFSPSCVHQQLMKANRPALAYEGEDFASWQSTLRSKLIELLGYDRMPSDPPPLNIRTLWQKTTAQGSIEKLVYTAEPGADVVAYLCLPKTPRSALTPVFLCLQGHSTGMHNSIGRASEDETTAIEVAGDRDFGLQCMARGIAALCIEQRGFGQRRETQFGQTQTVTTCGDAAMHALMLGRTLAAERIYDVARSIAMLHELDDSRDDVALDFDRLGCMGNSGGGTISIYAAAILNEIKQVMPSCSFSTYAGSIMSIYHCVDNYIPQMLLWAESADIVGLIAPRPVVIVNGQTDDIFPIESAQQAFAQVRRIYEAAGAADACQHVIGPEGHRFYADLGWDAMDAHLTT